jgi:hypothetical protein
MAGNLRRPLVGQDMPIAPATGVFLSGRDKPYGFVPTRPGRRAGLGETPALGGMFRAGRTVGVSQINAIATNVWRGT